jgi:penicillin-binding protein 1C
MRDRQAGGLPSTVRKPQKNDPINSRLLILCSCLVLGIVILILLGESISFPQIYATAAFDRDGDLLSAAIAEDGQWRFAPSDSLPARYVQSVIIAEDKRFFNHHGVDPLAVIRAAWSNLRDKKIVSGASTLTMQVVRMSRGNQPRTFPEKIFEMILAGALEFTRSKSEILGLYAAHAPYGGNVVGLEAAAWRYFGRRPSALSWAETATLAVLPNSPSMIHPGRNRSLLREKRDRLLRKLFETGVIDSITFRMACSEDLPDTPYPLPQNAPHLLSYLKSEIQQQGRFYTSIDRQCQLMVQDVLERHHKHLAANHVYDAAVVVIDNCANEIIAYAGNISGTRIREDGRYVDIIRAPRSTGSILKPFLYAAMLEKGELLPTQLVMDVPLRLGGFAPQNYSHLYNGAVPASKALARSLNVPAVYMLQQYGVARFHYKLIQLGMTTLFRPYAQYGLSLILGGAECTLWDISTMYAGFAESIRSWIENRRPRGKPAILKRRLQENTGTAAYHYTAGTAWLTLSAMLEVSRPDLEQFWQNFSSSRPVAWKTGTSYGHRDAWAVGVTPEFTIGVWVGNADGEGRPDLTGLRAAAPILFDLFYLMPPTSWFETPEPELEEITVCASSGYRPGPYCSKREHVFIPYGCGGGTTCPFCRVVHLDVTHTHRVDTNCTPDEQVESENWFILPPEAELYYRTKHPEYIPLPPVTGGCAEEEMNAFSLIYPPAGDVILVPLELDGEQGKTVLKAAHRRPDATLYWHIDNVYLGSTTERHELAVSPAAGEHRLTIVDDQGQMLEQKVRIIAARR